MHSPSLKDFWSISLVCKASGKASQLVKNVIADAFTVKESTWNGGYQSYIKNSRMLLHGPSLRMTYDGPVLIFFAFGKRIEHPYIQRSN